MNYTKGHRKVKKTWSECVSNNDRILPQESDISVNNFVDNHTRKLKCWSTNADSLCNKIDELKATVSSNSPDVITVTDICPKNVRDFKISLSQQSRYLDTIYLQII